MTIVRSKGSLFFRRLSSLQLFMAALSLVSCTGDREILNPVVPSTPATGVESAGPTVGRPSLAASELDPAAIDDRAIVEAKIPPGSLIQCNDGTYQTTIDGCTKRRGIRCRVLKCYPNIYNSAVARCNKLYPVNDKKARRINGPWAQCMKAARYFDSVTCPKLRACPR